jgi:hypothetical protein
MRLTRMMKISGRNIILSTYSIEALNTLSIYGSVLLYIPSYHCAFVRNRHDVIQYFFTCDNVEDL